MKMTGHTIRLEGQSSLCVPVHERGCSREMESDKRRLLSTAECKHVTLICLSVVSTLIYIPGSHLTHAHHHIKSNLTLLAHSKCGVHPVNAVFTHHASREDGKHLAFYQR